MVQTIFGIFGGREISWSQKVNELMRPVAKQGLDIGTGVRCNCAKRLTPVKGLAAGVGFFVGKVARKKLTTGKVKGRPGSKSAKGRRFGRRIDINAQQAVGKPGYETARFGCRFRCDRPEIEFALACADPFAVPADRFAVPGQWSISKQPCITAGHHRQVPYHPGMTGFGQAGGADFRLHGPQGIDRNGMAVNQRFAFLEEGYRKDSSNSGLSGIHVIDMGVEEHLFSIERRSCWDSGLPVEQASGPRQNS